MAKYAWIHLCLQLLLLSKYSAALKTLRTIDDTDSGITYDPQEKWNKGPGCTGCWVQPSIKEAFQGTWHDSTLREVPATISYTFTGTGVTLYCILANNVSSGTTSTEIVVILDAVEVGRYLHNSTNDTNFQYNVPVYSNTSLSNGQHNIILQNRATILTESLVLFDYLTYVEEDSPNTNTTTTTSAAISTVTSQTSQSGTKVKPPIGAIVGGVLGGILLILCTILAVWYIRRRPRRAKAIDLEEETERSPLTPIRSTGHVSPFNATPVTHSAITSKSNPSHKFNPSHKSNPSQQTSNESLSTYPLDSRSTSAAVSATTTEKLRTVTKPQSAPNSRSQTPAGSVVASDQSEVERLTRELELTRHALDAARYDMQDERPGIPPPNYTD